MSMSFGGSSGSSQSQQAVPDWIQQPWQTLVGDANNQFNRANPAYGGEIAPALSSGQTAAANDIYGIGQNGLGQSTLNAAINAASGAPDYFTGPVATPTMGPTWMAQAATLDPTAAPQLTAPKLGPASTYGGASVDPNAVPKLTAAQIDPASLFGGARTDPNAATMIGASTGASNMAAYQNPYEDQVVQSTLGDIERQRQQAINGNSSTATLQGGEGGAFGSRAGVSDSLTNEAALRASANAAGTLRSQGFDTAASNAQQDASRALAASQSDQGVLSQILGQNTANAQQAGLAGADAANSRALAQAQLTQGAGAANQGLLAQILGQNSAQAQQAGLAGAQAQNTADLTQAQLTQGAGAANQGVLAQILGQNTANQQQADLARVDAANTASRQQADLAAQVGLGNQQAGIQQANAVNSGAGVLGSLGQAQQGLALNAANSLLSAGNVEQQTQAGQDTAAYNEWLRQQQVPEQRLKDMALPFGFYPTTSSGGTTSTNSRSKSGQGGWS